MTLLLPLRQRLRRGFQQIEHARRRAPSLLVVDDEAGAVAACKDVRRLFGELLEHTCQLHILVLSRAPIYHSLGPTKVVNVPLKGLKEPDAAKLFLQRIHRMLEDRDFPDPVVGNADAGGVASQVTPNGPSLMDLAEAPTVATRYRQQPGTSDRLRSTEKLGATSDQWSGTNKLNKFTKLNQ
eukprot:Skav227191  [mRNA]  locus=scaffold2048:165552:170381:- [translate_table: standard]